MSHDLGSSEELSACFYAAATAVSHFNKQCALEEKRREAQGVHSLCDALAQHIRLSSEGNHTVQASAIIQFLHQQLGGLLSKISQTVKQERPLKQTAEISDPAAVCGGDHQARRYQAAVASLAQMYTHARQLTNAVEEGARRAAQDLLRFLSAYDGQALEKPFVIELLERYMEHELPSWADTAPNMCHTAHTNSTAKEGSILSRKRAQDDAADASILDPAFEQAFKRQRQPPPTPPSKLP